MASQPQARLPDHGIEYSKANRDLCTCCTQEFPRGEIRIMRVVYESHENYVGKANWYHVPCFARSRTDLGWLQSAESFPGFKRLAEEDKEIVIAQIP